MHISITEKKHNQSVSKLITVQAAVVTSWYYEQMDQTTDGHVLISGTPRFKARSETRLGSVKPSLPAKI
jgi:hypothetical protein